MLDALCPLGLLSKSEGLYALTPTTQAYLVRTAPTCCADIYLAWFQSRERFTDCVRTGTPAIDLTASRAQDLWVSYAAQFLIRWPGLAETMRSRWGAAGVHIQTASGAQVLDVACGSGVKSFMLAQADPTVRVTVFTLAERAGLVRAVGGLKVQPDYTIEDHPPIDLLLVPGGWGTRREVDNPRLIDWIRAQDTQTRLTTSVCTGAFLLGRAGLLDGHRVTTHWGSIERLRHALPGVTILDGVRFVDEGKIVTSAGISAGIDMALHLVARLQGEDLAHQTARQMEYTPAAEC